MCFFCLQKSLKILLLTIIRVIKKAEKEKQDFKSFINGLVYCLQYSWQILIQEKLIH